MVNPWWIVCGDFPQNIGVDDLALVNTPPSESLRGIPTGGASYKVLDPAIKAVLDQFMADASSDSGTALAGRCYIGGQHCQAAMLKVFQ